MKTRGPRTLSGDDRRALAAALRHSAAQARQVASCWSPGLGNIARVLGKASAEDMHAHLLGVANDYDRLAEDMVDSRYQITIVEPVAYVRPPRTGYRDDEAGIFHPGPGDDHSDVFDDHADHCDRCNEEREDPASSGYRPGPRRRRHLVSDPVRS